MFLFSMPIIIVEIRQKSGKKILFIISVSIFPHCKQNSSRKHLSAGNEFRPWPIAVYLGQETARRTYLQYLNFCGFI